MKPRVIMANGLHTEGHGNINLGIDPLRERGYQAFDLALPVRNAISARWTLDKDARIMAQASQRGDYVWAHSNGCRVALKAAELTRYRAIILFRPALARDYDLSKLLGNPEIHCVYSEDDFWVRVGALLLLHPFGRAGTHGMTSSKVTNHRSFGDHNADFSQTSLPRWLDLTDTIHQRITADRTGGL